VDARRRDHAIPAPRDTRARSLAAPTIIARTAEGREGLARATALAPITRAGPAELISGGRSGEAPGRLLMPIACRSYLIAGPPEAARILAITRRQTSAVQRRCGLIGAPLPPVPSCRAKSHGDAVTRGTHDRGLPHAAARVHSAAPGARAASCSFVLSVY